MIDRIDAAIDSLLSREGTLPWGKPSAADLAALLMLLDWHLILASKAPVISKTWVRDAEGLPCAPKGRSDFAAALEKRLGRISGQGPSTGKLDHATRKLAADVVKRYVRLADRSAFFKGWKESTPILSSSPVAGGEIDLVFLAEHVQKDNSSWLGRLARKTGFRD